MADAAALMAMTAVEKLMALPTRFYDIDPSGDVILAITKFKPACHLRVSSAMLSYSSPVFKTMLGPSFQEGQDIRSASHPKEITLPEDDPRTMQTLCEILHLLEPTDRLLQTASQLGCSQLSSLAVLTDKYGCTSAASIASEALLSRFRDLDSTKIVNAYDISHLITAAYLFDKSRYFALFTRRMAMDETTYLASFRKTPCGELLPIGVFLDIEHQRDKARHAIADKVASIATIKCRAARCSTAAIATGFTAEIAKKLSPPMLQWPPRYNIHNIRAILQAILDMPTTRLSPGLECKKHDSVDVFVKKDQLQSLCRSINKDVKGLCLECTRLNKPMLHCMHASEMKENALHDPVLQGWEALEGEW